MSKIFYKNKKNEKYTFSFDARRYITLDAEGFIDLSTLKFASDGEQLKALFSNENLFEILPQPQEPQEPKKKGKEKNNKKTNNE